MQLHGRAGGLQWGGLLVADLEHLLLLRRHRVWLSKLPLGTEALHQGLESVIGINDYMRHTI